MTSHRHRQIFVAGSVALSALLAGCGVGGAGGGTSAGDLAGTVGILTADFQVIDLASGTLESRASISDLASNPVYRTTKMVFRAVLPGSGQSGSAAAAFGAQVDEPLGTASVGKYFLGVFEVTQRQWTLIAGATSTPWTDAALVPVVGTLPTDGSQLPAYALSRDVVNTALQAYSTGRSFTFDTPTEVQWEHACRAGSTTAFFWGDLGLTPATTAAQYAVVSETAQGLLGPQTVGGRLPNAFGFYDMHGNVWEWTKGGLGTIRGGSWRDTLPQARSANRFDLDADKPHALVGVRLVLIP